MKKFLIKIWQGIKGIVSKHQFTFLILVTLIVAGISVTISIMAYVMSGAINIDLSRPGYESVREDTADEADDRPPFSPAGIIDGEVQQDFIDRLDAYKIQMSQMNDFGGDSLSNKSLNLE